MREPRATVLAAGALLLAAPAVLAGTACADAPACWTQPYGGSAPSGNYLGLGSEHIFAYNATSGNATDTGMVASTLCVGDRENRTHIAGVCEDVDIVGDGTSGAYVDQDGWVAIVGTQYEVVETLNVNGTLFASCSSSGNCSSAPNLGVTYWWYLLDSKALCADYPAGAAVAVDGHLSARDRTTGATFVSDDSATMHCP